jgi:hypothetical protein
MSTDPQMTTVEFVAMAIIWPSSAKDILSVTSRKAHSPPPILPASLADLADLADLAHGGARKK